jgi:hypothetical protein
VPSSPPGEAPLLHLRLPDGRPATLLLGEASTVLSIDGALVSAWDLAGRPYALVRETGTYRRGLDGRLLWKLDPGAGGPRLRQRLSAAQGEPVVEAARRDGVAALASLSARVTTEGTSVGLAPRLSSRGAPSESGHEGSAVGRAGAGGSPSRACPETALGASPPPRPIEVPRDDMAQAVRRLRTVVAMDAAALGEDSVRFFAASGPVGILPPDQYLSLVVRVTEGCSWNACTFCSLYRDVPFRAKRPDELRAHLAALGAYFGPSIALRRSVFLGDANALCLAHDRLRPLLEAVAARFPGTPLYSFLDAWTGRRKSPPEWREYEALGLRRVYVGLETGDPGLLAWLEKPGEARDAVDLVGALHEAGIAAGVVVLLGAGGERVAGTHAARTAEVLTQMRLAPDDLVYFSEYVDDPSLAYGRRAQGATDLAPLSPERDRELRQSILAAYHPADPARPPRIATYDIREFVY